MTKLSFLGLFIRTIEQSNSTSDVRLRGVGVDSFFEESESAETRQIGGNPPNWAGTRQNFDEVGGKPLIFVKNNSSQY